MGAGEDGCVGERKMKALGLDISWVTIWKISWSSV